MVRRQLIRRRSCHQWRHRFLPGSSNSGAGLGSGPVPFRARFLRLPRRRWSHRKRLLPEFRGCCSCGRFRSGVGLRHGLDRPRARRGRQAWSLRRWVDLWPSEAPFWNESKGSKLAFLTNLFFIFGPKLQAKDSLRKISVDADARGNTFWKVYWDEEKKRTKSAGFKPTTSSYEACAPPQRCKLSLYSPAL